MKYILIILLMIAPSIGWAQNTATKRPAPKPGTTRPAPATRCILPSQGAMTQVATDMLRRQSEAWNEGDLVAFMQDYWKSDSLRFIGSNGVELGWQNVLANYQRSYPNQAAMGKLAFDLLAVEVLGPEACTVVGRYRLKREDKEQEASGHFTLVLRRVGGQWVIASDHSS
jgi:hypothetical protein